MIGQKNDEYRLLKSECKYEGKVLNLRVDHVMFPNNKVFLREVIEHEGAVGVVPLSKDEKIILVKQYRHPINDFLLEIPAGLFHDGESPLECAIRELREETGGVSKSLVKLAEFYTTPGYSNEKFYLYLALEVDEKEPKPEDDEFLEIEEIDLNEAVDLIGDGKIEDGKTIIGLCLALQYITRLKNKKE